MKKLDDPRIPGPACPCSVPTLMCAAEDKLLFKHDLTGLLKNFSDRLLAEKAIRDSLPPAIQQVSILLCMMASDRLW
jgi:hypothetical protein